MLRLLYELQCLFFQIPEDYHEYNYLQSELFLSNILFPSSIKEKNKGFKAFAVVHLMIACKNMETIISNTINNRTSDIDLNF